MNEKLNEDDLYQLEALVKSPAYAALCKAIRGQRLIEVSVLVGESEPAKIFRTQGRIEGLDVIQNLPKLMADQAAKLRELREQRDKGAKKKK